MPFCGISMEMSSETQETLSMLLMVAKSVVANDFQFAMGHFWKLCSKKDNRFPLFGTSLFFLNYFQWTKG